MADPNLRSKVCTGYTGQLSTTMALTVHVLHTLYPDETQPETPSDDAALLSQARALVDYDEWRAPLPFKRSASSFARKATCISFLAS